MNLTKQQLDHDRAFCSEVWGIWKQYGGGTDSSDPDYWPELTTKLNELCKTKLEVQIAMAILEECRRRSK